MTETHSHGGLRRAALGLAALIPIVPIVIGVVLLASSRTTAPAGAAMRPLGLTAPAKSTPAKLSRTLPTSGSPVAVVIHATSLRSSPNGPVIAPQPRATPFGSPVAYYVRKTAPGGWLGVVTPLVGNGKLGWLPSSAVTLTSVAWKLEVSLDQRRLTVLKNGVVQERYTIAIGRPSAPTPTGIFAVTDRLTTGDPDGPYGCCILALSAEAPHAIQDWDGGNRIAIHSTPPDTYSEIGQPISHGCMHVTLPEGQWLIDHIPLGTPTIIRSD